MPVTFVTFGLGYLAIIGFPPFSGFCTKDKIIEAAFGQGRHVRRRPRPPAPLGAGITAFYMTRVMLMTFFGEKRWDRRRPTAPARVAVGDDRPDDHPGDGLGRRWRPVPHRRLSDWLEPVLGPVDGCRRRARHLVTVPAITLALVVASASAIAWCMYGRPAVPAAPRPAASSPVAARRDLYGDAFNEVGADAPRPVADPAARSTSTPAASTALVNGFAAALGGTSGRMRRLQTGFVRSYALSMFGRRRLLVVASSWLVRLLMNESFPWLTSRSPSRSSARS